MSLGIIIGPRRSATAAPRGSATADREIDRHVQANFYPTPPEATRALLSVECFDGTIWEPACGKGHIARVLEASGHRVVATDLNDWSYGAHGVDFLNTRHVAATRSAAPTIRHIVTNPPYGSGLADAFVQQALHISSETGGKVAMLLNIASLAHRSRTAWWKAHPPVRVWMIDSVVCWPDPHRAPPAHFMAHRYCWCVWTPEHRGAPALWWLSATDFI